MYLQARPWGSFESTTVQDPRLKKIQNIIFQFLRIQIFFFNFLRSKKKFIPTFKEPNFYFFLRAKIILFKSILIFLFKKPQ